MQVLVAAGITLDIEGVIEPVIGGVHAHAQAALLDRDSLEQLGVFGRAVGLCAGAVIEAVHLRARDRYQVHRADGLVALLSLGSRFAAGLVGQAAVAVIVALQHQVDLVAIEQRLPGGL